jgi:hypothetical protein
VSGDGAEKGLPCDGWDSCPNLEHEHRVERDLWWGYLCPALANIGALKEAQSDLIALGADWAEAGRILSRVQSFYVNAAHRAARRYLADTPLETSKGDDLERRDLSIGSAECSCAMTEGSQRRCPAHGEDAYVLPPEESAR